MQPTINKWLDFLDRVGWTAVQALAAAIIVVLTESDLGWEAGAKFVGVAVVVAIAKVLVGQNTGSDDSGSLIGQPVIEPPPSSPTA